MWSFINITTPWRQNTQLRTSETPLTKGSDLCLNALILTVILFDLQVLFQLPLVQLLPHSLEGPTRVVACTKSMVHMRNLFCCIHSLCDNVVITVIHGVEYIRLGVEWVMEVEVQVLVGVNGLSVYLHSHLPIFLARDQRISKWDTPHPHLWLVYVSTDDVNRPCSVKLICMYLSSNVMS